MTRHSVRRNSISGLYQVKIKQFWHMEREAGHASFQESHATLIDKHGESLIGPVTSLQNRVGFFSMTSGWSRVNR